MNRSWIFTTADSYFAVASTAGDAAAIPRVKDLRQDLTDAEPASAAATQVDEDSVSDT